jgi:putative thioredoxin
MLELGQGAEAPAADLIKDVSEATFMQDVVEASQTAPVIVDFWAPWCGPCKALTPTIEKIAAEFDGRAEVGKMDIQAHPQMAGQLGIRSIPTLLFFKGGVVVDQLSGVVSEDKIRDKMEGLLG